MKMFISKNTVTQTNSVINSVATEGKLVPNYVILD
jgi:hypothetical protein